jgi:hypothetical protein
VCIQDKEQALGSFAKAVGGSSGSSSGSSSVNDDDNSTKLDNSDRNSDSVNTTVVVQSETPPAQSTRYTYVYVMHIRTLLYN